MDPEIVDTIQMLQVPECLLERIQIKVRILTYN